jgi:hypothetical protein
VITCLGGACGAQATPGQACEEAADCTGCSNGAAVDCVSGSCRCANGADCSDDAQCQNTCVTSTCAPVDALCDDDLDCRGERKCRKKSGVKSCLLPDGNTCTANVQCEHVCRDGQCAAVGRSGDDCDENADCSLALVCRSGSCAAQATLGGSCDENADCMQGMGCATLLTNPMCLKSFGQSCTIALECLTGRCSSSSGSGSSFCY